MDEEHLFALAIDFFWRRDIDGQPAHLTPGDPGGLTNNGVIYATWRAWCAQHGLTFPTPEGFAALRRETFLPLLRAWYFNASHCGSLGLAGIGIFDMGCNAGPVTAVRLLQGVVHVTADGQVGPMTIAAAAAYGQTRLIADFAEARKAYYRRLPNAAANPGWFTRADKCRDYILSLPGLRASASTAPS